MITIIGMAAALTGPGQTPEANNVEEDGREGTVSGTNDSSTDTLPAQVTVNSGAGRGDTVTGLENSVQEQSVGQGTGRDHSETGQCDTVDADLTENENEIQEAVIKPQRVLKRHKQIYNILEERNPNRLGSVDIEGKAHADLYKLHDIPSGKTLEDELNELDDVKRRVSDLSVTDIEEETVDGNGDDDIINVSDDTVEKTESQSLLTGNHLQHRDTDIPPVKEAFVCSEIPVDDNKSESTSCDEVDKILTNGNVETGLTAGECNVTSCDTSLTSENTPNKTPEKEITSGVGGYHLNDRLVSSMPETRAEIDGCVSPSLMFASCRYRWEKTLVSQAASVVFVTLNKKEIQPIKLAWQESNKCYYSEEYKIPVGTYVGNMVIDGTFYPVEDITIKHYTFEVDLYLRDDIIDDEASRTGINKAEDFLKQKTDVNKDSFSQSPYSSLSYNNNNNINNSYSRSGMDEEQAVTDNQQESESGIHKSSKYAELLRTQMSQSMSTLEKLENETDMYQSIKSDMSPLDGRYSPVGEDGLKQYQDGEDSILKTGDLDLSTVADLADLKDTVNASVIEDDVEHWSTMSNMSQSQSRKPDQSDIIDDILGNGHNRTPIYSTESPMMSKHSSIQGSARQTPTSPEVKVISRPESVTSGQAERSRPESVTSAHSANSVSRHVLEDLVRTAVGRDGLSPNPDVTLVTSDLRGRSPLRTPPPQEQIGDVLNPSDKHSPIRREYLTGSPHSAQNGSSAHNSAASSQRQTPQRGMISDSLRASQEKLYSVQDIRRASGTEYGSQSSLGSRPQSLSSEQELTQYYEGGDSGKVTMATGEISGSGQRSVSSSSLPVIGSQRNSANLDKRSMTPDNHIRVPVKGPLLPSRTPPRTSMSASSSRTVTPANTPVNGVVMDYTEQEQKYREKIRDLEGTVSNLRLLLTSKEQEMTEVKGQLDEVKDNNRTLVSDVDYYRARSSPGPQVAELERKYKEVLEERDSLRTEVSRLIEEAKQRDEPGLNRYNPNSPSALQRKIDDLNSQMQDLQEVNESTVEELKSSEKRVKELAGENEMLRVSQSTRHRDTDEEVRQLKIQVQRLKEAPPAAPYTEATDYRIKIELQQVKEDNRNLRERNYTLHDENIRVKDELANLRKSLDLVDSTRKSLRDERKSSRKTDQYKKTEHVSTSERGYHGDTESRDYRLTDTSADRLEDKYSSLKQSLYEKKSDYNNLSERKSDYKNLTERKSVPLYDAERFTKSDASRYESYRSVPDGGSLDMYDQSLMSPSTPARPSALPPSKKDSYVPEPKQDLYEYGDRDDRRDRADRLRSERSRTTSAEIDYRSMAARAYDQDLSQTTPALSGRSRAIYAEISGMRKFSRNHSKSLGSLNIRPVCESNNECNPSSTNTHSQSTKECTKRYVPMGKDASAMRAEKNKDTVVFSRSNPPSHRRRTAAAVEREEKEYEAPRSSGLYPDDGDVSDTATDILVSAVPMDNMRMASSWGPGRARRGSVGSEGSNESFSDVDEQISASVRKRSKSADSREILKRFGQTGGLVPATSLSRLGASLPMPGEKTQQRNASPAPPPSGLRTVTMRPLITQHNKTGLSLSASQSLTHGLRPFAPRSAGDLQVNDVIKFSRQGGKLSQGTIKFIGHLPGRGDIYLGVELDKEDGKHDGIFEDIRYFKCKPNKGVFVAYNKVVMAWTTYN